MAASDVLIETWSMLDLPDRFDLCDFEIHLIKHKEDLTGSTSLLMNSVRELPLLLYQLVWAAVCATDRSP